MGLTHEMGGTDPLAEPKDTQSILKCNNMKMDKGKDRNIIKQVL